MQVAPLASGYSACGYKPASGRTFDGNGNVIGLIDMATGLKSATYDYNAFGETIQSDGVASVGNHYRFSTKYTDDETGMLYYGYRYYTRSTGRWLSKDPIEETGATNIYGFVRNNSVSLIDRLGLFEPGAFFKPTMIPPGAPPALGPVLAGGGATGADFGGLGAFGVGGAGIIGEVGLGMTAVAALPFSISGGHYPGNLPQGNRATQMGTCQECTFIWGKGDRGGHPGHTRYLQRKFGVAVRNVTAITPEGDWAGYDAGTPDRGGQNDRPESVYEVKTGYRFASQPDWTSMQAGWFFSNAFQFAAQLRVAARCKLNYRIMFSDEDAWIGHMQNLPELENFMQHSPW